MDINRVLRIGHFYEFLSYKQILCEHDLSVDWSALSVGVVCFGEK